MNSYKDWETKEVKVTNLSLDENNIRLDLPSEKSQDALIIDLFQNEDAMQILEGIVRYGFFPDELPVVIEEDKKMIVLEGNRRVVALKAIITPAIVPAFESKIKKLINGIAPIEKINVIIAPTRDKALQLLANKHTKVTRKKWQPLRQAYFYYAQYKSGKNIQDLLKEYPNVDIQKFIKMWEMHKIAKSINYDNDEIREKVHDQRKFPISTIIRLYEDPEFRNLLGFKFNKDGKIEIASSKEEFKKAIKTVVTDAVNKNINTRGLNDKKVKSKYFSKFHTLPKGQEHIISSDFTEQKLPLKTHPVSKALAYGLETSLNMPGIERRLNELKSMNYWGNFPNMVHDFIRTFLECTLKAYCLRQGILLTPKRQGGFTFLEDALDAVSEDLNKKGLRKDLINVINKIKSGKEAFSIKDFLDATNHNPNIFSVKDNVKDVWDTIKPLLVYLLNPE